MKLQFTKCQLLSALPVLSSLLLSGNLLADTAPPFFAHVAQEKILCSLSSTGTQPNEIRKLEFVYLPQACAMEGDNKENCYIARAAGPSDQEWKLGEQLIRESSDPKSICLGAQPISKKEQRVPLFSGGKEDGEISLICNSAGQPKQVELQFKGGTPKRCPLGKLF